MNQEINPSGRSKRITVLYGGWSAEREVSLVSGKACAEALSSRGHDVVLTDATRDLPALIAALTEAAPEIVFNALHGKGGEDGTIQGVLDVLGVRYTHSGVLASALAMDKQMAKKVLGAAGIPVPAGEIVPVADLRAGLSMTPPCVVKPNDEGSSVGVHIVQPGDNRTAIWDDCPDGAQFLVEPYIRGRDLTVAVMDGSEGPKALAVTEIAPREGFYDYRAKYTAGYADHIVPARVPDAVTDACLDFAARAHAALGCRGVSRADFRFDDERPGAEGLFMLEVNTQPGMTPLSLVPEQAAYRGIDFADLCEWLVEVAQ
ncbi:D-alanine--D-alanine ligase [Fodinicurvata sp. EGI_FJ10296]|uniref:D-alanine--D-alanine ligase n=1 Tax=Fodinicurvata sp. EGI_FJ10296 TaxID=3231908 RepID=UPI003454642D